MTLLEDLQQRAVSGSVVFRAPSRTYRIPFPLRNPRNAMQPVSLIVPEELDKRDKPHARAPLATATPDLKRIACSEPMKSRTPSWPVLEALRKTRKQGGD
jgi:hypothetical protein